MIASFDASEGQEMKARKIRTTPTNQKDIVTFSKLTNEEKELVLDKVEQLYDGTRTMADCWKTALGSKKVK